MPYKHVTRESIHGGLSSVKDDSKWSDLVNWRSGGNRTTVVQKKFKFIETPKELHSIISGPGSLLYAIGAKGSFAFRPQDDTVMSDLWELLVYRDSTQAETDLSSKDAPKLRGAYSDTQRRLIKLKIVDDAPSVTRVDELDVMDPVSGYDPELSNGDDTSNFDLRLSFVDDNGAPVPNVDFTIYRGMTLVTEGVSMGNGGFYIALPKEIYTLNIVTPVNFVEKAAQVINLTADTVLEIELTKVFVYSCLVDPTMLFGKNTHTIGRRYRSVGVLDGTAALSDEENDDRFVLGSTLSGAINGTVKFSVCNVSAIVFRVTYDADFIGPNYITFKRNGVLVKTIDFGGAGVTQIADYEMFVPNSGPQEIEIAGVMSSAGTGQLIEFTILDVE